MPPNLSHTTKYYAEERQWKQRLASIQVQPQVQFQPEVILKEKCITQNLTREREREETQRNDKMMHTCTDAGEGRVGLPCLREDGALFRMSVKG